MTPLEILAVKLPDTAITKEQRQLAIAEVEQEVKNHCHIEVVPPALYFVVANMAADLLRYEAAAAYSSPDTEVPSGKVTAISEGDTSVSFGKSAVEADRERLLGEHRQKLDTLILNYRQQLQEFRRLRWP